MVYLLEQASMILNIVLVILFVVIFIAVVIVISTKSKRGKRMSEDILPYSSFERKNSLDYIKIDDIRDDMIIVDNGRRFVGVIKCSGFDFYSESAEVQYATCNNFKAFINTINHNITYRQFTQPVDLEYPIRRYEEAYDNVTKLLFNTAEDLKELERFLLEKEASLSEEEKIGYANREDELSRQVEALKFRKFHLEDQIRVLRFLSGGTVAPDTMETWVFDWEFNPLDFASDLTQEEIEERAVRELNAIASAKIHALSSCNVKAYRCTTEELIDMCRRYSSPISADRYKLRDIVDSSFYEDICTSHSLETLEEKAQDEAVFKAQEEVERIASEIRRENEKNTISRLQDIKKRASKEKKQKKEGTTSAKVGSERIEKTTLKKVSEKKEKAELLEKEEYLQKRPKTEGNLAVKDEKQPDIFIIEEE